MALDFPNAPTTGQVYQGYVWDGQVWQVQGTNNASSSLFARSYLAGLTLSTPGSSPNVSISAGIAADNANGDMLTLIAALTKTIGAGGWSAGNGGGVLDTVGAVVNSAWYHFHLIKNPTTGVVDVIASQSATAPTLPSGFTRSRRIGSIKTTASGQWSTFSQDGDQFLWGVVVADAISVTAPAVATPVSVSVPTGVKMNALMVFRADYVSANNAVLASSFDQADQPPGSAVYQTVSINSSANVNSTAIAIRTDLNAQIRVRAITATCTYSIMTYGWIDRRGRDL